MSDTIADVRGLLEQRLQAISQELTSLHKALDQLEGSTQRPTSQRRTTAGGRGPATSRRGSSHRRRVSSKQRQSDLARFASENPTATNGEIAAALGVGAAYVSQLISSSEKVRRDEDGKLVVTK